MKRTDNLIMNIFYCFAIVLVMATITPRGVVDVGAQSETSSRYQFDDVIYQPPEGWKKGKTHANRVILYHSGKSFRSITIFRSDNRPGNIESWVGKKLDSLMENRKKELKDVASKRLELADMTAFILGRTRGRKAWLAFATVGDEKINLAVMETRVARGKDGENDFERQLNNEFLPFALRLRYVSQGAEPILGKPVPGDLDGTFHGLKYTYKTDMTTNVGQQFYNFSKSGRFLRGLPKGVSVLKLDYDAAISNHPSRAGNYRVDRDKILLEFADGTVEEKKFEKMENGFKMVQKFTRAAVPNDGATFDGVYSDISYTGFVRGTGVEGGVVRTRSLTFTSSGQFVATRFFGVSGNIENANGDVAGGITAADKSPDVSGTYEIKNGALVLIRDRGNVKIFSVVQIGDRLIYVDGQQYLKSDKKRSKN